MTGTARTRLDGGSVEPLQYAAVVTAYRAKDRHLLHTVYRVFTAALLLLLGALPAAAQANGHLQIHYLKVGQGDAALVISPLGETMLIDSGPFSASNFATTRHLDDGPFVTLIASLI